MSIAAYDSVEMPSKEEMETMVDLVYRHTDILIPPILKKVSEGGLNEEGWGEFADALRIFWERAETLNKKPVFGYLPKVSRHAIPSIIEEYHKHGVSGFVVDFDGKAPASFSSSLIRAYMQVEKTFANGINDVMFYAINANSGTTRSPEGIIPARDILSFGMAFDIIGEKHKRKSLPKHLLKKLKEGPQVPRLKAFDRRDYGYRELKGPQINKVADYVPDAKDALATLGDQMLKTPAGQYRFSKVINWQGYNRESSILKERVGERNVTEHLKGKTFAGEDALEQIGRVRKKVLKR